MGSVADFRTVLESLRPVKETTLQESEFYRQAFYRNIGLISDEDQARLRRACVGVVGAGGVGGLHLLALTRMGVGRFHLADFDTFELGNFNRQFGASVDTIGQPKIEVMAKMVQAINPHVQVDLFHEGIQPNNIGRFLEGVDVVVDGIDFFAYDHRRMLFNEARKRGVYVVTSGPIGFGSTLQVFAPTGMSFDEYFGIHDGMSDFEKFLAFGTGLAPALLHRHYLDLKQVRLSAGQGPVVASSCILSSGLVAFEAVNILLRKRPIKAVPHYYQFDAYRQVYKKGYLAFGYRNPLQYLKRWIIRRTMKRLAASQPPSPTDPK
jgi:molybdopterin/thiamine biosynthesis adenylyltransferase